MDKFIREQFLVEVLYFDGTKECAQKLVDWAGSRLKRATTGCGEEILLVNTYGDDWFAVSGGRYIAKSTDGYVITITPEEFKKEYVKI